MTVWDHLRLTQAVPSRADLLRGKETEEDVGNERGGRDMEGSRLEIFLTPSQQ